MGQFLDRQGLKTLLTQLNAKFVSPDEIPSEVYLFAGDEASLGAMSSDNYDALNECIQQGRVVVVNNGGSYSVASLEGGDGSAIYVKWIDATSNFSKYYAVMVEIDGGYEIENEDVTDLSDVLKKTNSDIVFDSDSKKIQLKVGGVIIGDGIDATPFIKDGMLDDTDVIVVADGDEELINAGYAVGEKLIKFVWNTDGGNKTDYIKVSDIAVEPDTNTTEVADDIIIAGGPLADTVKSVFSSYKDADNNTIVPKDMTLHEFLTLLLCKEEFPTSITTTEGKLESTIVAPTVTMSTSSVEVGTSVSYTVKNGKSGYKATAHKASGFTWGWSAQDDNSKDGSDTSKSATFGTISVLSDQSTLNVTSTGNEAQSKNGTATAETAEITGAIVAVEGKNKVSATNTSATYKGTCGELPVYYGCSNTGKTHKADGTNYPSTKKDSKEYSSTAVTSSASEKEFTAYYKWFMGCVDETLVNQLNSAKVRAVTKSGNCTKDGATTILGTGNADVWTSDGRSIIIACPSKYKLSTVTDSMGNDYMAKFNEIGDVAVKTGGGTGAEATYKVYMYPITSNTEMKLKGVTLVKA